MTKILDLVPSWVYAIAVAALIAFSTVQTVRVAGLQADVAEAALKAASLETARADAARDHEIEKARLVDAHQLAMSEKERTHAEKLAAAEVRARADADTVRRLRNDIATYSRRGATCLPATPVADGAKPPAEVLGGLLGESLELLVEGRRLLEDRDAEVELLIAQIDADRAACSAKRVTSAPIP